MAAVYHGTNSCLLLEATLGGEESPSTGQSSGRLCCKIANSVGRPPAGYTIRSSVDCLMFCSLRTFRIEEYDAIMIDEAKVSFRKVGTSALVDDPPDVLQNFVGLPFGLPGMSRRHPRSVSAAFALNVSLAGCVNRTGSPALGIQSKSLYFIEDEGLLPRELAVLRGISQVPFSGLLLRRQDSIASLSPPHHACYSTPLPTPSRALASV